MYDDKMCEYIHMWKKRIGDDELDPSSVSGFVPKFILLAVLLGVSGFFSSAETALTTVNKHKMRAFAEEGNRKAKRVLKLVDNPGKLLSTILIGNNIANILASSLATVLATQVFGNAGVGIATGVLTVLILIFGEITPKNLASIYSEKLAMYYSGIIWMLTVLLSPIVWMLGGIEKVMYWLFRVNPEDLTKSMTESELRTIVDVSHEDGVIEVEERKMINNVVDFGDTFAKNVMIPRADMVMVSVEESYEEILSIFQSEQYSRLPVYEETKENIVGVLYLKDVFFFRETRKGEFSIQDVMREPFFVYEYQKTSDIMETMRGNSSSISIVLDEYGVAVGLVTIEDLLEEIVGEIRDEYDEDEWTNIQKINEDLYDVDGSTKLSDLNEVLGTEIESEDYDSVAGHIIELLDHLPVADEETEDQWLQYKVLSVDKTRIERVEIRVKPVEAIDEDQIEKE